MSNHGREDNVLNQLIDEAREQAAPELDWDRMERRLMQRVDSEERAAGASQRWRWVGSLAAAAVIALGIGAVVRHQPSEPAARSTVTSPEARSRVVTAARVDGSSLAVGDEVRAGAGRSWVHHAGQADWTLSSGGRAVVAENGAVITVKLLSGSVEASVVPSAKPETFAVEVDDTRVAVHGTKFRVERGTDGVRVEVSEGVVGVGPVSDRGHPAWLLRHGDSGRFALDGRQGDVKHAELTASEPSVPEPANPAPALPSAAAAGELAKAADELSRATTSCFASNTAAEGSVRVQVETTMSLAVSPNGFVGAVTFDPPLLPSVQSCVAGSAKKLRLSPSQHGGNVSRSLLLGS
jgi:hypothetical protein